MRTLSRTLSGVMAALVLLAVSCTPRLLPAQAPPAVTSNEPPGFRTLAAVPCERLGEGGFKLKVGRPGGSFDLVTDPERGPVCQFTYRTGFVDGGAPANYFLVLPNPRPSDLFLTWYAKTSANFVGHPVGYKQVITHWANTWLTFPRIVGTQQVAGFTAEKPGTNRPLAASRVPYLRGGWHFNELLMTGDGHVSYWVDGRLVTDADIPGFPLSRASQVDLNPIMGGNQGWRAPDTITEAFDEFTVKVPVP